MHQVQASSGSRWATRVLAGLAFATAAWWSGTSVALPALQSVRAATNQDGRLELFMLGADGAAYNRWQVSPGACWGDPAPLQGHDLKQIAAGANRDGRLELFALGADGAVYHRWQVTPNGGWGDWAGLQGHDLKQLSAATNGDGRLHVFALGSDGAVYYKGQASPGGGWGDWSGLQGHGLQQIAAAANQDGRFEVFAVGADGIAYHRWQVIPNGGWSDWASLEGHDLRHVAIGRNSDGRLELFALGADGAVYHRWQAAPNGGWTPWAGLEGHDLHDVTAATNRDGRLEILALGSDGQVYQRWQASAGSGGWVPWIGLVTCTPTAAASNPVPDADALAQRFRPYLKFSIESNNRVEARRPTSWQWLYAKSQLEVNGNVVPGVDLGGTPAQILDHADIRHYATDDSKNANLRIDPSAHEGQPWSEVINNGAGLYAHVAPVDPADPKQTLVNIEYWILFGYNDVTFAGAHEGDLVGLHVVYDRDTDALIRAGFSLHGHAIQLFDLSDAYFPIPDSLAGQDVSGASAIPAFRVEVLGRAFSSDSSGAGGAIGFSETPPYLWLVPDPGTGRLEHLAAFLEWGSHEAWPNSEGRYISVPTHNGVGISFLPAKVELLTESDVAPFLFYGGHLGDPTAVQRHRMWFGSTEDHDLSDLNPYERRDNVFWPPFAPPCAGCSWQRPTSDEDAPALWACASGVATGMNCSGSYCDNVSLRCCTGAGAPGGTPVSTPFFSEEGAANGICPDNRFVTGIRCQGSYCDNMSLSCSVTNHSKGMCSWTPFFSEEWPEHGDCPRGTAIAGARCQGSYCDNVSLLCCELK